METTAAQTDDELAYARTELRQLRETVEVLRIELEDAGRRLAQERQRATAEREAERERAREGMQAMRERLQEAVAEREDAVRAAFAQSADEVAQLKATVETLRASLVAAREEATALRDAGERAFRGERDELHETIAVLRARLEAADAG